MNGMAAALIIVSFTKLSPPLSVEFSLYGKDIERCEEVKWNVVSELELDGYAVCATDCKWVAD